MRRRRFLLPAGVKFKDDCGPDGGSMSKHMGLRTAPIHGSVLHVCGQGTGVCSTPHRMGVCSTPSCWTPRAAGGPWECAPHVPLDVLVLKDCLTEGARGDLEVWKDFGAALSR